MRFILLLVCLALGHALPAGAIDLLNQDFEGVTGTGGGMFVVPGYTFDYTTNWDDGIVREAAFGGVFGDAEIYGGMFAQGDPTAGVAGSGGGVLDVDQASYGPGSGWFAGLQFNTGPLPGLNVLANPGFEDGGGSLEGWSTFGNAFVETADPPSIVPRSGAALCKLFGAFPGDSGIYQDFLAEEGQVWTMGCFGRHNSDDALAGGNWVVMKLEFRDFDDTVLGSVQDTVLASYYPRDIWIGPHRVEGVAPAGTDRVRTFIIFVQPAMGTGAGHIDDVSITLAGSAPTDLSKVELAADVRGSASLTDGEVLGEFELRIEDTEGDRLLFRRLADGTFQEIGGTLDMAVEADADGVPTSGVFDVNSGEFRIVLAFAGEEWGFGGQLDVDNLRLRVFDTGAGDFNNDGVYDCADVDQLVEAIALGSIDPRFDLTGDGRVDQDDFDAWLGEAGMGNLGAPYLPADADLDGFVDGLDFIAWNGNKFTELPSFCGGDFRPDGNIDGTDFVVWYQLRFMSSGTVSLRPVVGNAAVPQDPLTSGTPGDGLPDVYYYATEASAPNGETRPAGTLSLDTDGSDFVAVLISSPDLTGTCILCDGGSFSDPPQLFAADAINGSTQWVRTYPLIDPGPVGVFDLARLEGLGATDFPPIFEGDGLWSVVTASDDGSVHYSQVIIVDETSEVDGIPVSPTAARLLDARPNPTAAGATMSFSVDAPTRVRLTIFDVEGRRVRTLVDGTVDCAEVPCEVRWDGRNDAGDRVTGVFFFRLETPTHRSARKLVVLADEP